MKSVAEIAIVGLIGTFTIVAGILIPPSFIKSTIGKELLLTYNFETAQNGLLTFLSSMQDGKSTYELIGTKIILKNSADINKVRGVFDKIVIDNCILVNPEDKVAKDAFTGNVCEVNAQFNTIIVVPYNKNSLVEVIGIGVK